MSKVAPKKIVAKRAAKRIVKKVVKKAAKKPAKKVVAKKPLFQLAPVKKVWNKQILGWNVARVGDNISFGCGAVKVPVKAMQELGELLSTLKVSSPVNNAIRTASDRGYSLNALIKDVDNIIAAGNMK